MLRDVDSVLAMAKVLTTDLFVIGGRAFTIVSAAHR